MFQSGVVMMKGIILAGGSGTRLYPLTKSISKQILPLYDKPMIYYPLSTLMLAGIREILIISTSRDIVSFRELFGDGKDLGMTFEYAVQVFPRGLSDAFIIGRDFIGRSPCAMVLGDNIFYGSGFSAMLKDASSHITEHGGGGLIFGYYVKNPSAYGVVEFSPDGKVAAIEEKPANPKSHYAVSGLYFYDNSVVDIAQNIKPSERGEIEITSINNAYLKKGKLEFKKLGRGIAWLDTGTYDGLMEASNFVATIQKRQGMYVACIEEIAHNNGWISKDKVLEIAKNYKTEYGDYLRFIAQS
jgi:glucose-1-phosphate thymidylyltransferase